MRIIVTTCIWKRHDVFKVWAENIAQCIKGKDIGVLCVGSEGEKSRKIVELFGFQYTEYPNEPLGKKFNHGARIAVEQGAEYILSLGSDDIISENFLDYYLTRVKWGYEVIAPLDCYFWDAKKKRLGYWPGYTTKGQHNRQGEPCGAGRLIPASILKTHNFILWTPDRNHAIDWEAWHRIKEAGLKIHTFFLKNQGLILLDIKKENINPFSEKWEILPKEKIKDLPGFQKLLSL